jgi:hypothetical protein
LLDHYLCASAHAGHERGEVTRRFRFRDVDHGLGHNVIIHRYISSEGNCESEREDWGGALAREPDHFAFILSGKVKTRTLQKTETCGTLKYRNMDGCPTRQVYS